MGTFSFSPDDYTFPFVETCTFNHILGGTREVPKLHEGRRPTFDAAYSDRKR